MQEQVQVIDAVPGQGIEIALVGGFLKIKESRKCHP
jgi:hypothetical protein